MEVTYKDADTGTTIFPVQFTDVYGIQHILITTITQYDIHLDIILLTTLNDWSWVVGTDEFDSPT